MKESSIIAFIPGIFWLLPGLPTYGQQKTVFTPEDFIQQVRQQHPMAKQAGLLTERAAANLLNAKGSFDPVFEMQTSAKTLDGENYYRYTQPNLKIPTPIGIGVKAGFENSSGQYMNPELTNGVASYVGLDIPLLNGLLTDKRRTALQQAKIFARQSEADQQAMINDLLLTAYTSYWDWAAAYQKARIYSAYLEIAANRKRLITLSFENGDRSAADTLEAFAQMQNYRLLQADALQQLNYKIFELSLYLWTTEGEPYLLPSHYVPDTAQFTSIMPLPELNDREDSLLNHHPLIKSQQFKLQGLEAERKLKFQNLLPMVNLQANLLSKDYFQYKQLSVYYLENNYKLGLSLKIPLFLRSERGDYQGIKLKIREANFELAQKNWQLQTKFRQYYNEAAQLREQILLASHMHENYRALLSIEELRFSQGESSLFLINSRENKALEMEQKRIELQGKYMKAVYAAQWASGLIGMQNDNRSPG